MKRRSLLTGVFAMGLASVVSVPSWAQNFPTRPITIVVPFAAGGSTDIVARVIAQKMTEVLGQSVVVENRAGAGGATGASAVAKSAPDGYTLLLATVATHAINPAAFKKLPFDPVKDFSSVALLAYVPNVLIVTPKFPAKDVKELIALLKANPGKYSYASSGVATPLHLSGELFKSLTQTDFVHVPYRGGGPALADLISGQVPIMFDNLPSAIEQIRGGGARALAVTTKERSPAAPDIPTMIEAGVPGYETYTWNAFLAPANTPKNVIAVLNDASNKATSDPQVKQKLADLSAMAAGGTPEQLDAHIKAELAKWGPIVKAAGVSLD